MKTMHDIVISHNAGEYRAMREALHIAIGRLISISNASAAGETPEAIVGRFIEAVGHDTAVDTIATLVNHKAWWDGDNMSSAAKSWANEQPGSFDSEAAMWMGLHKWHINTVWLDWIALAMIEVDRRPAALSELPVAGE